MEVLRPECESRTKCRTALVRKKPCCFKMSFLIPAQQALSSEGLRELAHEAVVIFDNLVVG